MPLLLAALLLFDLALWAGGEPARTVFLAALPAWAAFAAMLAPLLRRYRAAMGLTALAAPPAASRWGALWHGARRCLDGLRVVLLGLLASALPFLAALAQWLAGQDLSLVLAPPAAGRLGFALGAVLFLLPFLTSWLHLAALSRAAETVPASHLADKEAR